MVPKYTKDEIDEINRAGRGMPRNQVEGGDQTDPGTAMAARRMTWWRRWLSFVERRWLAMWRER